MPQLFFKSLLAASLFLFHNAAFGVDPSAVFNTAEAFNTFKERSPLATIGYIFQTLLALIIVFILIYVAYRYLLPKLKIASQGKLIEVVDRVGLEPGVSACIVKVKNRSWLVMVSNKTIEKIDEIEM